PLQRDAAMRLVVPTVESRQGILDPAVVRGQPCLTKPIDKLQTRDGAVRLAGERVEELPDGAVPVALVGDLNRTVKRWDEDRPTATGGSPCDHVLHLFHKMNTGLLTSGGRVHRVRFHR